MTNQKTPKSVEKHMKIGVVMPHIFMHEGILPHVIFSPGQLAINLCDGLVALGHDVTLFTPGKVSTSAHSSTADLSYFETELAGRGDTYLDLLKKHPFTFVTLARQVQSELIAKAFSMANSGELDVVHIYGNEEDIALPFAQFCAKPVVFTHHDPYNFLVKYKNVFPKYKHLNWISTSYAQRRGMPENTHWVGNIYHGLDPDKFMPTRATKKRQLVYMGRIIEQKGVELAIQAVLSYNANHKTTDSYTLVIAGKHYAEHNKDTYWQERVEPLIDGGVIRYAGYVKDDRAKQQLISESAAMIVPSIFDEPFGMVLIEALACGTPVIGLDSGAIPEVIKDGLNGLIAPKVIDTGGKVDILATVDAIATKIADIPLIDRDLCRRSFEAHFTLERMCTEHTEVYAKLIKE